VIVFSLSETHAAVSVLFSAYFHVNAVPAAFLSPTPLTVQPSNLYPAREHVFAAGVKLLSYVAVVADGAVPAPSPHEYVTLYLRAEQPANVSDTEPAVPYAVNDDVVSVLPDLL
jgi:hypothetical protein